MKIFYQSRKTEFNRKKIRFWVDQGLQRVTTIRDNIIKEQLRSDALAFLN